MLVHLSDLFKKYAKGWLVLTFLALDIFFMVIVMPNMSIILRTSTPNEIAPLDLKFFYTPEQAFTTLEAFGQSGRDAYKIVEMTADIIYPIVYTIAFGLLLTWLFKHAFDEDHAIQRFNILPIGAWLFDLLENLGIVSMLNIFPNIPVGLAWVIAIFTAIKWLFAVTSMTLIVIALLAWGMRMIGK